jgi:hypothetical protein
MTSPVANFGLGPKFDAFLFARIGEDNSGLPLSVVTVLARLDVDPWQEAARLAALVPESAARELASILGAMPEPGLTPYDIQIAANRLAALLPRATGCCTTSLRTLLGPAKEAAARWRANVLFLALYLIAMLATQFIMVSLVPSHATAPLTSPVSAPSPLASPAPNS